jgi:murein DD-endopeptidase MepM/ murein hydrolase activator NlpD
MGETRSTRSAGGVILGASRGIRWAAITAVLSVLLGIVVVGGVATSAAAEDDYPTYADVQEARADTAKAKALIKRIDGVIKELDAAAAKAEKESQRLGTIYQEADQKVQEQALRVTNLQEQADAAKTEADGAKQQAAEILVQQYRSSGTDVSLDLFLNSNPDDLLYSMGMSSKIVGQSQGLFESAVQLQNTAQSLSDQATVAETELGTLRDVAEKAFDKANAASIAAAAAVAKQEANKAAQEQLKEELEATEASTEADYQKGVVAREKAAAAARNNVSGVYSGPPVLSIDGQWARPAGGRITSSFGYRINPFGGGSRVFHLGTDLGAGCGSPIYAAHAGKITYSGWNGVYGNFIRLDIGDGVTTEYGHIVNGGLLVGVGESVNVGDHIANVGSTGGSTGCHLHFGVRINGLVTNPVPFMAGYGVTLG